MPTVSHTHLSSATREQTQTAIASLHSATSSTIDSDIYPNHAQEWLESGVHPDLINANVRSLSGYAALDYLFYSDCLPRTNAGRIAGRYLRDYAPLEAGGWWCSGLDPLNNWKPMMWGQFKPDCPRQRIDYSHNNHRLKIRVVKYEPPPKVPTRAYFLNVPDAIAQQVYKNVGIQPAIADQQHGFWHCVKSYNLPIVITEGAKKAGALLTAGYAAIALPGISSGYRVLKDDQGTKISPRHLIPELQYFATAGRSVFICFDHDLKPVTRIAVQTNVAITGRLLASAGCTVRVIDLPGPEKGVDDFIVSRSAIAFSELFTAAPKLMAWRSRQLYQLSYPASQTVCQRFLSVDLPQEGLVFIKSPKGTGKTALLEPLIHKASQMGRKTLVISHRIQLGQAICTRLGIDYISEVDDSTAMGLLGVGLCIDSLHPNSQAQFNPQHWQGAIVVLDECEQVLWHALNSTTCRKERVTILNHFRVLLQIVLSTGGLIIAQDADLSDFSVDLLCSYATPEIVKSPVEWQNPWIVVNNWKPSQAWDVQYYHTPNPTPLWADLEEAIARGPVFICMDAQKPRSKWGTVNVEARLSQQFPDRRILRIDSRTVRNPSHPAYGCIDHLNTLLPNYDIVIASPSLGTGVSIDVVDHFVGVFGIFQGTVPDSDVRQALARVRQPVPRYVWVNSFGIGKIANGATDYRAVASSQSQLQKANLRLLKEVDFDLDDAHDAITFRTWAKYAARINSSLTHFRDVVETTIAQEGHHITQITASNYNAEQLKDSSRQQKEIRDRNQYQDAEAIANAETISDLDYERRKKQRRKTEAELHQEEKHRLELLYGIEVSPELYLRHQNGWHEQLQLHYYLIESTDEVRQHDRQHWQDHLTRGQGHFCPQDIHTYSERVEALKLLGLLPLLEPDTEWRGTDEQIQAIVQRALQWRSDLKTLFRITVIDSMSPMQIIQILLGLLGLKLQRDRRARLSDGSRCWVYRFTSDQYSPDDALRQTILATWRHNAEHSSGTHPPLLDNVPNVSAENNPQLAALNHSSENLGQLQQRLQRGHSLESKDQFH